MRGINQDAYRGVSIGALKTGPAAERTCVRCGRGGRDYRKSPVCGDCRSTDPWFAARQNPTA